MKTRSYAAIDLKSFYASVECQERDLDPMTTNLVVADAARTEKTICLAVSPSLKAYGISGRARLFEVVQRVREVNAERRIQAPGGELTGATADDTLLRKSPELALDYLVAPPQMAHYMDWSTRIYQIYLNYVAPEDIHVYSIDEVFMDLTDYLPAYGGSAREMVGKIIREVLATTGITATAGLGTNLYLAKVAMDIEAKKIPGDEDGVRIAELDELSYRRSLWTHRPLRDFWRVGRGYSKKLEGHGLFTMGDIARCSLGGPQDIHNEELLYRLFGVNAELLIDHAWGWEPCTIAEIKAYKPNTNSIGSGQVLQEPYPFEKARLIVREMTDLLVLDLVEKGLVTDQIVISVGYDIENIKDGSGYQGPVTTDGYGRKIPKHAHGTANLGEQTASVKKILAAVTELFERIVDPTLLVRRAYITANHVVAEEEATGPRPQQLDMFTDVAAQDAKKAAEKEELEKERRRQEAIIALKKKYGKNAVVKGMNLEEGATTIGRNKQIGGHKA